MIFKIYHNNQLYVKKLESNINSAIDNLDINYKNNNFAFTLHWSKNSNINKINNIDKEYVCNPLEAINNSIDKIKMYRILKLNGIDTPIVAKKTNSKLSYLIDETKTIRNYKVFVFQFHTVIMYKSNDDLIWLPDNITKMKNKYYEVAETKNFESKKVSDIAKRAVYSLGLDFASVIIGITSNKKRVVLDVDYKPKLNIKREKLYREIILNYIQQYVKDMDTTDPIIGADPEFMLKDKNGKMVLASKYFPKNGRVGCDARTINRDKAKRPLAELRPEPCSSPDNVVENIKSIIDEAVEKINLPSIQLLAGSMPFKGYYIGGHIHFSNVKLNTPIARALDNYLAIPIALIEDPLTSKKRRLKYGFLGDVRNQFHGGFEYRTLGSWVLSPQITKAVLYLSQFIVKNYTSLRTNSFLSIINQKHFYSLNREQLKKHYLDLWKQLEIIPGYMSIQKHVNIIPEMIYKDHVWDESYDLKLNWNSKYYRNYKKTTKSS